MLDPGSFTDFYRELWGYDPFAWQRDLAAQVHAEGWPGLVDLPTGSGKTATIDIAVFLLALDADRPAADRAAPRRIVTVVDRRVVVDQAADRAGRILAALRNAAPGTVLARVAGKLRDLWAVDDPSAGEDPEPFAIGVLRGGVVRDETWARRPDVPAVLASTVDQVGSRLLFRGYGISRRMAPVHAGLLGTDTLFLLDEVHLSRPFAETLRAVERHREAYERSAGASRWAVVELSATPGSMQRRVFPAAPLDPASSPVLHRRLLAAKPAELRSSKGRDRLVTDCAAAARELLGRDHA
jgi:CRISPR-associated endonuclease/helicase Cas3